MPDQTYDYGREGFLGGDISWRDDSVIAVATDSGYTPDFGADQFLEDVPAGARVSTTAALTGKTITAGVADCDDLLFEDVVAGKTITGIVFVKDTGDESTSRLIGAKRKLSGGADISIPTSGGDILFRIGNGDNKLFKL
jgi:hypothetical protein